MADGFVGNGDALEVRSYAALYCYAVIVVGMWVMPLR